MQAALGGERFRVYTSDDATGVAIGGALKNVIAIAVGCCDGFGFGNNARAALITRGLAEIGRLASRLGGAPADAGWPGRAGRSRCSPAPASCRATARSAWRSRAARRCRDPRRLGHVAEGIGTARTARDLAIELGVEMPITHVVAAVLHEGKPAREGVVELLARESKAERG